MSNMKNNTDIIYSDDDLVPFSGSIITRLEAENQLRHEGCGDESVSLFQQRAVTIESNNAEFAAKEKGPVIEGKKHGLYRLVNGRKDYLTKDEADEHRNKTGQNKQQTQSNEVINRPHAATVGDEILYTPHNTKYDEPVTGFVTELIRGSTGESGYHVRRKNRPGAVVQGEFTVRLWGDRGTFTKTGKRADWADEPIKPVKVLPANLGANDTSVGKRPYKSAGDLAAMYKQQGMDKHRSWDQFVIDTILSRRYLSESLDARDFYKVYDRT